MISMLNYHWMYTAFVGAALVAAGDIEEGHFAHYHGGFIAGTR